MLARIISDCGFVTYSREQWLELLDLPELHAEAEAHLRGRMLERYRDLYKTRHLDIFFFEFSAGIAGLRRHYDRLRAWFLGSHGGDWLGAIPRDILGIITEYMWFYNVQRFTGGAHLTTHFLGNLSIHGERPSDVFVSDGTVHLEDLQWYLGSIENDSHVLPLYEFSWFGYPGDFRVDDHPKSYRIVNTHTGTAFRVRDRSGVAHDPVEVRRRCLELVDMYGAEETPEVFPRCSTLKRGVI